MIPILELWLPIVVSAVFVFFASSLAHMVLTYHKRDYLPLPKETETLESLRRLALAPGLYVFPHCTSSKDMAAPEMQKKYAEGPVGNMAILPTGPPAMGKHLGLWFAYCLLVSLVVGYLAGLSHGPGAPFGVVFCFTTVASFLAYGLCNMVDSIWKAYPWGNTVRAMIDGLLYCLATGAAFGWLWPA